jgi:flagellar biosynthesis protein FliR
VLNVLFLGFHLTLSSGLAYTVLVIEALAIVFPSLTAWLMLRPSGNERG